VTADGNKLDDLGRTVLTLDQSSTGIYESREGQAVQFRNIGLSVRHPAKEVLRGVTGRLPPQQVTAVMGPSGSGKTSLLKVLTGRVGSRDYDVSGEVQLGGRVVDPTQVDVKREIAYVEQDVSVPVTATPREAIRFSARLRLDRSTTEEGIELLVDEILTALGLSGCADTMIGGGLMMSRGLSGGEKKRTQCGVELVTKPNILVLDEPTTGLDSFSAEQLVDVLKRITLAGASVLLTIHQPPPPVVRKIDHLILLLSGRHMYEGAMGHELCDYFAGKGFPKPTDTNIADWILVRGGNYCAQCAIKSPMSLLPIPFCSCSLFFQHLFSMQTVAQSKTEKELEVAGFFKEDSITPVKDTQIYDSQERGAEAQRDRQASIEKVGWTTEIAVLFDRDMKHLRRDKAALLIRLVSAAFFGLLYGLIYFAIGTTDLSDQLNLQAEFGAIATFLVTTVSGVAQSALMDFPKDRPVFLREYSTNHYSVIPYFLSRFLLECTLTLAQSLVQLAASYFLMRLRMRFGVFLVLNFLLAIASTSIGIMIGSSVEDPKVAAQLMPALIVPQLLFSGIFISIDLIPSFLRWVQYVCPLMYAMRLSLFYEFGDCEYETCTSTLERNGVNEFETYWYWIILAAIVAAFRIGGLISLKRKANF
jgi:ABC-type multidrug transport system ATPase subunit/ABC-type multidrug transport system permease subunit